MTRMATRTASVDWVGKPKEGHGKLTTQSGALSNAPCSFGTRFENQPGTNPEELIAAAHGTCFTMALAAEMERRGFDPQLLHTDAAVTLTKEEQRWSVTKSHLSVYGRVPDATSEEFDDAARSAKENCPISRLLNAQITFESTLMPIEEEPLKKAA